MKSNDYIYCNYIRMYNMWMITPLTDYRLGGQTCSGLRGAHFNRLWTQGLNILADYGLRGENVNRLRIHGVIILAD